MNRLEELTSLLGSEKVCAFDAAAEEDRSAAAGFAPAAVAVPETDEDVVLLMDWARENRVPLVPVSSAGPHYRGTTKPEREGAVLVDMRRMDRILTVTREQRILIVEPGVTHEQIEKTLAENDLAFPMPLAPKAGKSVLASALELEPRINCMHSWNAMEPLRCIDAFWADGTHMFTGSAAGGPMDLEKQHSKGNWQLDSSGPALIDYYRIMAGSLGTLGIAGWVSLRCEVLPKEHVMFFAASDSLQDVTDLAYDIILKRFSDELFVIDRRAFAKLTKSEEEVPEWILVIGIAGRDKAVHLRVEGQTLDIREMAQARGLSLLSELGGVTGEEMLQIVSHACPAGDFWKERGAERVYQLIFLNTLDKTGAQLAAAKEAGLPEGSAVYVQPLHQGASCQCEILIPYRAGEEEQMRALADRLADAVHAAGGYFSRNYGGHAARQIEDREEIRLLRGVKNIFDPQHMMNPGKLGQIEEA